MVIKTFLLLFIINQTLLFMRKLIFLLVSLLVYSVHAQDTTALRFIAITTWDTEDILFFNNDTSDMYGVRSTINDGSGNFTSHGIFVNPNDGYLYGIADPYNFTVRSLYKINPLTGQFDSIMVIGDHPTSIAVTPDGRLFAIEGNGGATPGAINEIDLTNLTQTQVAVSNVTANEPRAIIYNPNDSSLYIYSSDIDSVFIMKVDTWVETREYAYTYQEVHGGYYRDNQFWLASYYGEISHVNLADSLGGDTLLTSSYNLMDLTEFNLLKEPTDIGVCLNVPLNVVLHARYTSNAYFWYKNDTLISGANVDSLIVSGYGEYKLLTEIDTSSNYIWSETVNVHSLNVPNVSVSTTDTLWCADDTIQLTGSFGGISQWFLYGTPIAGADSNIYLATATGYYNMTKTNLNGCMDSASVGITIVDDPNCPTATEEEIIDNTVSVYPTPFTNVINISSADNKIQKILITDVKGTVLSEKTINGNYTTVDASAYKAGIYFLKIISTNSVIIKQIVKQ